MTPVEWFAFVILPAALAIVALGASKLFDVLHPVPSPVAPAAIPIPLPLVDPIPLPRVDADAELASMAQRLEAALRRPMDPTPAASGRRAGATRPDPPELAELRAEHARLESGLDENTVEPAPPPKR